ncbi:MAG: hypothetical protein ACOC32_03535 [Nanoarchaeota archaeon]
MVKYLHDVDDALIGHRLKRREFHTYALEDVMFSEYIDDLVEKNLKKPVFGSYSIPEGIVRLLEDRKQMKGDYLESRLKTLSRDYPERERMPNHLRREQLRIKLDYQLAKNALEHIYENSDRFNRE